REIRKRPQRNCRRPVFSNGIERHAHSPSPCQVIAARPMHRRARAKKPPVLHDGALSRSENRLINCPSADETRALQFSAESVRSPRADRGYGRDRRGQLRMIALVYYLGYFPLGSNIRV